MTRLLCQFSCGAASAVATKLAIAQNAGAERASIAASAGEPRDLNPRHIRKFLQALQAGEMSVSRAVEILDAWVDGYYKDEMVPPPPPDSCLIADDEFPMEIVRKLRSELAAAPPTAQAEGGTRLPGAVYAALSDSEIDRIVPALEPVSEDFPAEWAVTLWKGRERIRKELRASHGQAPAQAAPAAVAWRELCRRLYVELFYCDQQMTSGKRPKWQQGKTVLDVLADAKAALDAAPQPSPTPQADSVGRDAERWRTFIGLPYEIRAEWAANLSLVPVLTQWVDQAAIDAAMAANGGNK